ncbi:MAG TPA: hypothetical protein VIM77_14215, partial [Mucilaginibacter sp.]
MSKCLKYLLVIWLTGVFYNVFAQAPTAGAKLDSASILIGEQTQLHLSIRFHTKDKVEFPVLADSIAGRIMVIGSKADTTFDKSDATIETIHKSYLITAFDSGEYVIPSYAFKTTAGVVNSPSLTLRVQTVKVDTTKAFYDIKQPMAIDYSFFDWLRDNWQWVAGALLILLIIGGIIYYIKTRPKKVVVIEPPKAKVPPHIIALQKLADLRSKKLYQQEQVKQYHIELSDILREYLEYRYTIKTHEQTTDEIFAGLRHLDIAEENKNLLRQVLVLADLVKFA